MIRVTTITPRWLDTGQSPPCYLLNVIMCRSIMLLMHVKFRFISMKLSAQHRERRMDIDFTAARKAARAWQKNGQAALDAARRAVESGDKDSELSAPTADS